MIQVAARLFVTMCVIVVVPGCGNRTEEHDVPSENGEALINTKAVVSDKTFAGEIEIARLPRHFGLRVSLVLFPVSSQDDPAPYDGEPPGDAVTDTLEVYNEVDLDSEINLSTRTIPFSVQRPSGHYYLQVRAILYRKQGDKVFAQAEQFFFGRRPLSLLDDLPSVTLPVVWPSISLDETGVYGTVRPQE